MSSAAVGNLNTLLLSGTPRSASSSADTIATVIVIVGAISRNSVASQSFRTPGKAGLD